MTLHRTPTRLDPTLRERMGLGEHGWAYPPAAAKDG